MTQGGLPMDNPKLMITKRQTLADQLYGQILEQIVSNTLKQGERLPSEHRIATAFGVSRPVVREALRKLQEDGLVEARRGVGSFVRRRPPEKLIEFATAGSVAGLMRAMEARMVVEHPSRVSFCATSIDTVLREHRQILEAIKSGDSEAAAVSMSYHLLQARQRVTDHSRNT